MATVIFDFDSTLIGAESLEEILRPKLNADQYFVLENMTSKGMEGDISFRQSLQARLSLTPIKRADFIEFGHQAIDFIVPGMPSLVRDLIIKQTDVWIVTGAFKDCVMPVANHLGIPPENVISLEPNWDSEGNILDLGSFNTKWEAAKYASKQWLRPSLAIGDGITDWELYSEGLVDQFIAFTQIARRPTLLKLGAKEARDVEELKRQLRSFIHDKALFSS